MRITADCSRIISGEHYVSAAILSEFGNLRTSGLPWFGPGETRVGKQALRSNILCTRHNSALAPLDKEGWRVLVAVRDCLNHISRRSLSTRTLFRIASGDAFELWGLKTLMGLLQANVARAEGKQSVRSFDIDNAMIARALTGGGLPSGFGLYVGQDSDLLHDSIGFAPLTHLEDRRISGLRVSFLGVVFDFLIDPPAAAAIIKANDPHYRPVILDFEGSRRTGRLILTRGDRRIDCQRLSLAIRSIPPTAPEATDIRARLANKQFDRLAARRRIEKTKP